MIDIYRIMFFKYLYNQLNISNFEKILEKNNIHAITDEYLMSQEEKICFEYSRYFYLVNDIDIHLLTKEEKEYFKTIRKDSLLDEQMIDFLENTYRRVLPAKPKTNYGPSPDYSIDRDHIVLGFKYDELGFIAGKLKSRKEIENENYLVNEVIKKIESNHIFKIKVIKYNELYRKNTFL